jgi:integrase
MLWFMAASVSYKQTGVRGKMATKIGLRDVAALPPNSILWDQEVRGFNVRRQFSETITFSVVYRTRDHVQRWQKIGRYPVLTPHLARQEAIKILRAVALGEDPAEERQALRNAMTIAQLCDSYLSDLENGKINGKKLSTIRSDKSRIKHHIALKIGKLKIVLVTSEHVEEFMNSLTPGSAKRTVGLLGSIFSYAIKKRIIKINPCAGVDKPKENKRTRRLSNNEYAQLASTLPNINKTAASVITLLLITGWRSGEAKNLRWSELDLERQVATLGDTKTGISVRPLSAAAVDFIRQQPVSGAFVFEYQNKKPIPSMTPHWYRLKMTSDITPHTLRHSFASLAADLGLADHTIAGLLGHSRQSITSRYMHLADKALIEAADLVAGETMRLMRSAISRSHRSAISQIISQL